MIKSDYGHLYCPFYEQKFDNGLKLIFIPSKSHVRAAGVYIAQGGFKHDEMIDKSKIPFGTPYVLERVISRKDIRERFLKEGAILKSHTDFSYTSFSVFTLRDVFKPFQDLLKLLVPSSFDETDVEKAKQSIKAIPETDLSYSCRKVIDNLYYSSPIKYGIIPEQSDLVSIHYTALKKYLQKYYTPSKITLFVIGDYTPDEVLHGVDQLRMLSNTYPSSVEKNYEENYATVKESYQEEEKDLTYPILSLGIKFQPRKELYEKYGQLLFYIYEILVDIYFAKNKEFLKGLEEFSSHLVNVEFKQGSEDTYLVLQFMTEKGLALKNFLVNYITHLNKKITRQNLSDCIDDYYSKSLSNLVVNDELFDHFVSGYANNLPYTGIITQTTKIPYKSFQTFTTDFMAFPRSIFYLKKK